MRFVFILLVIAGALLAIGYPWAVANVAGYEIGKWRVYDLDNGFSSADAMLAPKDAPVRARLEMTTNGVFAPDPTAAVLTVTAKIDGRTELAEALTFDGAEPKIVSPQSKLRLYETGAGALALVSSGKYTFAIAKGDAEQADIVNIDLVLNAGAFDLDPRTIPIGIVLMVVGVCGFVFVVWRKRRREDANPEPPKKRWGRG